MNPTNQAPNSSSGNQERPRVKMQQDIYLRVTNPQDFQIINCSPNDNEVVLETDAGRIIVAIERGTSIDLGMRLINAEITRVASRTSNASIPGVVFTVHEYPNGRTQGEVSGTGNKYKANWFADLMENI